MRIRDLIRKITPSWLLRIYRSEKKNQVRNRLQQQKESGDILSVSLLVDNLKALGISEGDTLLVHTSMSKIGYMEDGPKTFVDALIETVGPKGNIMMPTSPNQALQLDYVRNNSVFDVMNSPSRMGAISEYFRKMDGVERSLSPTEPVAVLGPDAPYLTEGHSGEETPYTEKSPFYRLYEFNGKILYVGVTLDNAGTNLHTLEDAVDFPYPVYYPETFDMKVIDKTGHESLTKIKVHNPAWSAKRKCDQLLPMFKSEGVYKEGKLGNAHVLVFDGKKMFETMVDQFQRNGVTMYHPHGRSAD